MEMFADKVQASAARTGSFLVAGCDPVVENLPRCILAAAEKRASTDVQFFEYALRSFCELFVAAVAERVVAVKPNIAFFERHGVVGVQVFADLLTSLKEHGVPTIIDAKRGDIGSTATAYSAAFLGSETVCGRKIEAFEGDALTVNPYLGFDTLEPFIEGCCARGKGICVLVQTSNQGSKDVQGLRADGHGVSEHVAAWLGRHAERLQGTCGWSGLGAVVGAPYPDDARRLRALMPRNVFLIPGLGAQGAPASDAVAGFGSLNGVPGGALINVSRGLLEYGGGGENGGKGEQRPMETPEDVRGLIVSRIHYFNDQITSALTVQRAPEAV